MGSKPLFFTPKSFKHGFNISKIKADEEALFWWECSCSNVSNEHATLLLDEITKLYINLRGFCYAAKWMEKHKQTTQTHTQKTKSLRSKLQEKQDVYEI